MNPIELFRKMETVSEPNEVVKPELPAIEILASDFEAAFRVFAPLELPLSSHDTLNLLASIQCRERQLMDALLAKAVVEADFKIVEEINHNWRNQSGYWHSEDGELHHDELA